MPTGFGAPRTNKKAKSGTTVAAHSLSAEHERPKCRTGQSGGTAMVLKACCRIGHLTLEVTRVNEAQRSERRLDRLVSRCDMAWREK